MRAVSITAAFVFALVVFTSRPLHAQDPYSCIDELSEAELDARLAVVGSHFERGKRRARAHFYGWLSFFLAVTAGQAIMAGLADEQVDRFSNTVGAVGAGLMSVQIMVLPQVAAIAPQRFARMPDRTMEERRLKLRYGLDRFELAASRASAQLGAFPIISPLIWSGTWATTIMIKFDAPLTVLRLSGGGLLVTQARYWTTPRDPINSWRELRGMNCGGRYVRRYSREDVDALIPEHEDELSAQRTFFMPSPLGFSLLHVF